MWESKSKAKGNGGSFALLRMTIVWVWEVVDGGD